MQYLPQRELDLHSPFGDMSIKDKPLWGVELAEPSKKKRTRLPWVYKYEYDSLKAECDLYMKFAAAGWFLFVCSLIANLINWIF